MLVAATAAVHQGQPSTAPSTTPICSEHCLKLPGKNLAFLLASSPSPVSHPSQGPAERVVLAPAHRGRVQRGARQPLYKVRTSLRQCQGPVHAAHPQSLLPVLRAYTFQVGAVRVGQR